MDIRTQITEGRLDAALSATELAVQANPLDFRSRTTLFTLLSFTGQYERAQQQLTVLGQENAEAASGVTVYRSLLEASLRRDRVLRGEESPQYLLQPPSYAAAQETLLHRLAAGDFAEARQAVDYIAAERPPVWVRCGAHSGSLSDADDRVAAVAELFLQDRYVWLPWEQIRSLHIPRPQQLRDLLWTPVDIALDVGQLRAFMPVLYPGSEGSPDPLVRLGRMSVWRDNDFGLSLGMGARLLSLGPTTEMAEATDIPLLEVGNLLRLGEFGEDLPFSDPELPMSPPLASAG